MNSDESNDKYRVIFVLGAPGAGKNTQCDKIIAKYGFVHFSCGDLLREAAKLDNDDGRLINEIIKEGKIVPVRITCKLAKDAMDRVGGKKNIYIIDGYPRNKENLDGWFEIFGESSNILAVLYLDCPKETCGGRIKLRSEFSGRIDDNDDSLKKRFTTFDEETLPNLENLAQVTNIIKVNSNKTQDEVFSAICVELDKLLKN